MLIFAEVLFVFLLVFNLVLVFFLFFCFEQINDFRILVSGAHRSNLVSIKASTLGFCCEREGFGFGD